MLPISIFRTSFNTQFDFNDNTSNVWKKCITIGHDTLSTPGGSMTFNFQSRKRLYNCKCLFICLSVYLSVCLSICLSVYLSVCQPVNLSVCLSVSTDDQKYTHDNQVKYIHYFKIHIYKSICLSVWLSVCLSICLSV